MKKIFILLLTFSMARVMYSQGVGIGTTDPHAPLQFVSEAAERKIVLYEGANNDHQFIGFGVTGFGALKYQTATWSNDHVFQSALSATSSLELMRIKGTGNVGIGIDPVNQLDISQQGFPRTGIHPSGLPLYITGDLYDEQGIEFRHYNGTQGIGFGFNTIYATGSNVDQSLGLASRGDAPLIFKTNGLERMYVSGSGNVGIGVFPNAQLQLSNLIQNRKIILYDNSGNDFEFYGFGISGGTMRYHVSSVTDDHVFFAGSSPTTADELMRIKGNGNVGVGISTVNNRMDIHNGTARTGTHATGLPLYVTGNLTSTSGAEFRQADGTQGIGIGNNTLYAAGSAANQDLALSAKGSSGNLLFKTAGSEKARITGSGNMGIGTQTPNAPLQFASVAVNRKIVLYENANNDHQFFGLGINNDGSMRFQVPNNSSDYSFNIGINSTTSTEIFRIKGTGQVGMGVAAPLNKLDINYGPARIGTHPTGLAAYITSDALPDANGIEFRHYTGVQGIGLGYNTVYAAGSIANQDLNIAAKGTTGNVVLKTNGNNRLTVAGNGNIGINNDTPHGKLHFATELLNRKIVLVETADDDNQFLGFGTDANACIRYQVSNPGIGHVFYTGTSATTSKELMRIMGSGNVGINMSTPLNRLDINNGAAVRTGTHATGLAMYVTGDFGAASTGAEFRINDGTQGIGIGYNTIYAAGSNVNQDLNLNAKGTTGNLILSTNATERLKINGSGNIGLGVTNPINKLDIHNGTARTNTHNGGNALYVTGGGEFRSADATTGLVIGSNTITASGSNASVDLALAAKGASGNITFTANTTEKVRITSTGKVGIGTNAPNGTLQFAGVAENRKIVLFETVNNDQQYYGFGVNGNVLRYQTDQSLSDHVFYSAIDAVSSKELMRIKGNGKVGIGTSVPNAPLQFSNVAENRKLVLYEGANNDHQFIGLGHNTTSLRYQVNATTSDHIFYAGTSTTTSNELMRIEGTGEVGIGISTPSNKLDIASAARTGTHGTGRPLYVTGALGSNSSGVEFRTSDGTQGIGFGYNTIYAAGSVANQNLGLEAKGTSSMLFTTNSAERMRITGLGHVGIGTITPNGTLQFGQTLENRKIVLWELADDDHQYFGFGVNGDGTLRYQTANLANDHVFYAAASSTTSNELMRIKGDGKVGIGTSAPHAALQFNNNSTTKKVVLQETANNTSQFSGFGVDVDGSMRYQVPTENAEHIFYTGAGPDGFIELMRIGSFNGLTIEKGTTINSSLTTTGNVTVGGTLTTTGGMVTEAFIAPTLLNSFTNYLNGYATAAYYKDNMGIVHLRGLVQHATNQNGLVVFTLPAGYRPSTSGQLLFTTQSATGLARIDILPNGSVTVMSGSTGWISMDGITFRAD